MSLDMNLEQEDDRPEVQTLFANLKYKMPELEALLAECRGQDLYGDRLYRFYHQSYKVYSLQDSTLRIVAQLKALLPGRELNSWFMQIVAEGTRQEFDRQANEQWLERTRPIVESFLHALYFLEMAVISGQKMDKPLNLLPTHWASILHLFNLR